MIEPKGGEGMPMLRSLKELEHYAVSATDGDIGHVADFLLDDERWIVRYLVVDRWLLQWAPSAYLADLIPASGLVDPRLPPGVD